MSAEQRYSSADQGLDSMCFQTRIEYGIMEVEDFVGSVEAANNRKQWPSLLR